MVWEPRHYRRAIKPSGLVAFEVVVAETDLQILAERRLAAQAGALVRDVRAELERYVATHPRFAESFVPLPVERSAPAIVRRMAQAAEKVGVGPMAAVAGAVAESVARGLSEFSSQVIVENGGDIYLIGSVDRTIGLWAGDAGARGVGIVVPAQLQPCAVATSSGTIGPSVSLGEADSATVIASSGALADAAASLLGNRIRTEDDMEAALAAVREVPGVLGAVASVRGAVGAWGQVELVPVDLDQARF